MPLSKDDPSLDYDGSWADASAGWPSLTFATEAEAKRAHHIAWKECKVPYGSYVLCGLELRLETKEYRESVAARVGQ